jgi:hypothetical protein
MQNSPVSPVDQGRLVRRVQCVAYLSGSRPTGVRSTSKGLDRMLYLIARCSITLTPKFCSMISTAAKPRFEGTRREERVTLAPER